MLLWCQPKQREPGSLQALGLEAELAPGLDRSINVGHADYTEHTPLVLIQQVTLDQRV